VALKHQKKTKKNPSAHATPNEQLPVRRCR